MSALRVLLRYRWQMVRNLLRHVRRYVWVHIIAALGLVCVLVGGGTLFFFVIFNFLVHQEVFGPLLLDRLLAMIFLAFFLMLVFSNLVITLSTNYISREVEFLLSFPVSYRSIFWLKFCESLLFSSWAFAVLSLPLFIAFGWVRGVGWQFFPVAIALLMPFLLLPAGLGNMLTLLISALLPARKGRIFIFALGGLAVVSVVVVIRLMGIQQLLFDADDVNFQKVLDILRTGYSPYYPHFWFSQGLVKASAGEYGLALRWLLPLGGCVLVVLGLCGWLVEVFYYRGWCRAQESGAGSWGRRGRLFERIERVWSFLPSPLRALTGKDLRVFWRDPAQWTQLIILFGLLFIYVANLRSAQRYTSIAFLIPKWKTLISFFNLGAACFIFSIISTRFIFPTLSLEGKQYWVVGLAPLRRATLIWQKYIFNWFPAFVLTQSLMLFSNLSLGVDALVMVISHVTVLLLSLGLTSLAVGLGAMFPEMKEENPARIANGLGGTLNIVLSLFYLGVVLLMEAVPGYLYSLGMLPGAERFLVGYIVVFVSINLAVITVPLYMGIRRWERTEF